MTRKEYNDVVYKDLNLNFRLKNINKQKYFEKLDKLK